MSQGGYDDMGPRIDLGGPSEDAPHGGGQRAPRTGNAPTRPMAPVSGGRGGGGGGGGLVAWLALLVATAAFVLAVWVMISQPEPMVASSPMVTGEIVPGGTPERTAKLEKDVGEMMLRLVTLEKELKAVASKAGPVAKLSEISNRLAGLQDRVEDLAGRPVSVVAPAPAPAPAPEPKAQAPSPEPKPQAKAPGKKSTYTVQRGDTLYTVAQKYGVTVEQLKDWNDIEGRGLIKIGEDLVIYQ